MKPIFLIAAAAFTLMFTGVAIAQYEGEIEIPDNVLDAIREFNEREAGAPNEVIVVLDPPASGDAPASDGEEIDDVVASILADESVKIAPGEPAPQGPEVRVQPLRELAGAKIKAADVKVSAPFAAKPLGLAADGWKLVSSAEVTPFTKNVEVSPGTWLTLSIRPHVLAPEADGQSVFQILEPGFNPALGYKQDATISSSIASTIQQLEHDSQVLEQVISDLDQILISLPRSASVDPSDDKNRR